MRGLLAPLAALFFGLASRGLAGDNPGPQAGLDAVRPAESKATQGDIASVLGGVGITAPLLYFLFRAAHRRSR